MDGYDSTEIDVSHAKITTLVVYDDGPEYRKYDIAGEDLPQFLAEMNDDTHAETVVDITPYN